VSGSRIGNGVVPVMAMAGNGISDCHLAGCLFLPPFKSQCVLQLCISWQVAGGGGDLRFSNEELAGDQITGGSAKKRYICI